MHLPSIISSIIWSWFGNHSTMIRSFRTLKIILWCFLKRINVARFLNFIYKCLIESCHSNFLEQMLFLNCRLTNFSNRLLRLKLRFFLFYCLIFFFELWLFLYLFNLFCFNFSGGLHKSGIFKDYESLWATNMLNLHGCSLPYAIINVHTCWYKPKERFLISFFDIDELILVKRLLNFIKLAFLSLHLDGLWKMIV